MNFSVVKGKEKSVMAALAANLIMFFVGKLLIFSELRTGDFQSLSKPKNICNVIDFK